MKLFLTIILAIVIILTFVVWPLQLLWNWLMPDIFCIKTITFWQALGVFLLSSILFRTYNTDSKNG